MKKISSEVLTKEEEVTETEAETEVRKDVRRRKRAGGE